MKWTFSQWLKLIFLSFGLGFAHFLMQASFSPAEPQGFNVAISVFFGLAIGLIAFFRMRRKTQDPK